MRGTAIRRSASAAVYLVRHKGEATPTAFTAKCPHAGCFVGYTPGDDEFKCPCHTSTFKLDGTRVRGDAEVAPRDMDRLNVEVRSVTADGGAKVDEVWVEFVDFQTGRKERIPTADDDGSTVDRLTGWCVTDEQ